MAGLTRLYVAGGSYPSTTMQIVRGPAQGVGVKASRCSRSKLPLNAMKPHVVIIAVAFLPRGCATSCRFRPRRARAISRTAVSSAGVEVGKPRRTISAGASSLAGLVRKNLGRQSTAGSSPEVTLVNAAGEKPRGDRADFTPAELPFPPGPPPRLQPLQLIPDAPPAGSARIEVRVPDGGPLAGG